MADYLEDPYADPARQQRSSGTKRRRKKSGEDDEDAGARVKPVGPKRAMDGNGMIEATDSEKSRFQCVRALISLDVCMFHCAGPRLSFTDIADVVGLQRYFWRMVKNVGHQ